MHKYKVNMYICTDYYNWVQKKRKEKKDKTKGGTHGMKTDLVPLIQPKLLRQADVSVGMDDGRRHVADGLVRDAEVEVKATLELFGPEVWHGVIVPCLFKQLSLQAQQLAVVDDGLMRVTRLQVQRGNIHQSFGLIHLPQHTEQNLMKKAIAKVMMMMMTKMLMAAAKANREGSHEKGTAMTTMMMMMVMMMAAAKANREGSHEKGTAMTMMMMMVMMMAAAKANRERQTWFHLSSPNFSARRMYLWAWMMANDMLPTILYAKKTTAMVMVMMMMRMTIMMMIMLIVMMAGHPQLIQCNTVLFGLSLSLITDDVSLHLSVCLSVYFNVTLYSLGSSAYVGVN